eukprot:comp18002_c0_seq2/m.31403 comp18002_c0_seq2/g.31403  ORF comp18002_c0_seq2/g.31403 comp18002_c0_seq2/m.31403 type:complete len:142 (+) comp18002_c0_seq2:160-585(+)
MKLGVVLGIALLVALSASDVLDNTAPPIGPPADKGTMMALYYAQATGALGIHVVNPFGFESLVTPFHRDNAFLLGVGQFAFDRAANVFYAVRAQRGTNTAEIIGINVRKEKKNLFHQKKKKKKESCTGTQPNINQRHSAKA